MNNTRLYIENKEVELDESVQFAITKQFEEITNPTVIINDWSKTVSIPFTTSNNRLFGHIYSPDKALVANYTNEIDNADYGLYQCDESCWYDNECTFIVSDDSMLSSSSIRVKLQNVSGSTTTTSDIYTFTEKGEHRVYFEKTNQINRLAFELYGSPYSPSIFFDISSLANGEYTISFTISKADFTANSITVANIMLIKGTNNVSWNDVKYSIGTFFDPYKKLDFRLEWNGDLLMSGYAKMNTITQNNGRGSYNITLNGQLGKVFQEMKKITFDTTSTDTDYIIDGSAYVDAYINKELVKQCWEAEEQSQISPVGAEITDIIGFAPNNSFSNDFDYKTYQSGSVGILFTDSLGDSFKNATGIDPDTAIPNGLLPREIGEYRSYQQLPYIYFNKLFQIFQRKAEGVTGYKFNLDSEWFNISNPYWFKTVFMLSQLTDDKNTTYINDYKSLNPSVATIPTHSYSTTTPDPYRYGYDFSVRTAIDNWTVNSEQYPIYNSSTNMFSTYEDGPEYNTGTLTLSSKFTVTLNRNLQSDTYARMSEHCGVVVHYAITDGTTTTEIGQVVLTDEETDVNLTPYTNRVVLPRNTIRTAGDTLSVNIPKVSFVIPQSLTQSKFQIVTYLSGIDSYSSQYERTTIFNYRTSSNSWAALTIGDITIQNKVTDFNINITPLLYKSNSHFTLNSLWNKEYNLFTEILKYCKIFRIGITVDEYNKTVNFKQLPKYFRDYSIVDWTEKLDRSKDYTITPISWDSKYVLFNYKDSDTKLGEDYRSKYGVNYGDYRLSTDYNFNSNTAELFEDISDPIINTDNVLSWTNLFDNKRIIYSFPNEISVYSKDKDQKYVDCFGQLFFFTGLRNWSTEAALNLRDVYLSDDTSFQQANSTYFYSQRTNSVRVLTYPSLENYVVERGSFSIQHRYCLFNVPKESYTYQSTGNLIRVSKSSIYSQYWKKYIDERYNVQNKILTCYIKLKPADYINFKFNQFIVIENQLYFVNKIYDFDITSNESTKVDLITIQNISGYTNGN